MKRQPSTPSDDDLRLLSEHLHYEVVMTFGLARLLVDTQGAAVNRLVRYAQLEAFTIHVRQLIDVLWGDRKRPTDAVASDYFAPCEWANLRPERPAILSDSLYDKVGWGVAHLTYGRAHVTPQEKLWDPIGLAQALAPAVICFADNVDPAKLEAVYLNDLKPWAQAALLPATKATATRTTVST